MSTHAFLTIDEAADLARCSPRTLHRRHALGLAPQPAGRNGSRLLYRREDVIAWLTGGLEAKPKAKPRSKAQAQGRGANQ